MKFKENDVCMIKKIASAKSAKFYSGIQAKYPTITCPCHISTTEQLKIVGYVLQKYVIVTLISNPKVISIFYEDDIYKVKLD